MQSWANAYSGPVIFSVTSVILILVLGFLAYLVSRFSALPKMERDRLEQIYPLLIFTYLFMFQNARYPMEPVTYLLLNGFRGLLWHMNQGGFSYDYSGPFVHAVNTGLCCAFGVAFSFRILRARRPGWRIYGGIFLCLFLGLLLNLSVEPMNWR